jgi:Ni/Fe-hydrogenase subunit HybB-like protein
MPDKLHALWYTPLLPVFFFISAVAVGLAMTIFESTISSKVFRRGLEIDILSSLGKAIPFVLGLYLVLKMGDLLAAGEFGRVFEGSLQSNLFLVEMVGGVLLPIVLFSLPKMRRSESGLFWGALLVIGGVILNRFNVSLLGVKAPPGTWYFPHWMEFAITIFIITFGLIAFTLAVRFLPMFDERATEAS